MDQFFIIIAQILLIVIVLSVYFAPTLYAYQLKSEKLTIHLISNALMWWTLVWRIAMWIFVCADRTTKRLP